MTSYYAAHDQHVVYGTGSSPHEALRNAAENGATVDHLNTTPISEALNLWIMENGWDGMNEVFEIRDGALIRITNALALSNIEEALIESILSASPAAIREETIAAGLDPDDCVADVDRAVHNALTLKRPSMD